MDFHIKREISTLNLSGSEEIYKLRHVTQKKTIEQSTEELKSPAKHSRIKKSRHFDEIPPAGYKESKPISTSVLPRHLQGMKVGPSVLFSHLKMGIVQGILLLGFTLGSEIVCFHIKRGSCYLLLRNSISRQPGKCF